MTSGDSVCPSTLAVNTRGEQRHMAKRNRSSVYRIGGAVLSMLGLTLVALTVPAGVAAQEPIQPSDQNLGRCNGVINPGGDPAGQRLKKTFAVNSAGTIGTVTLTFIGVDNVPGNEPEQQDVIDCLVIGGEPVAIYETEVSNQTSPQSFMIALPDGLDLQSGDEVCDAAQTTGRGTSTGGGTEGGPRKSGLVCTTVPEDGGPPTDTLGSDPIVPGSGLLALLLGAALAGGTLLGVVTLRRRGEA